MHLRIAGMDAEKDLVFLLRKEDGEINVVATYDGLKQSILRFTPEGRCYAIEWVDPSIPLKRKGAEKTAGILVQ